MDTPYQSQKKYYQQKQNSDKLRRKSDKTGCGIANEYQTFGFDIDKKKSNVHYYQLSTDQNKKTATKKN